MKGDFTRDSFERRKSFSRVMMQQGRVQIDADWNEQTSLTLDFIRTLAGDILGRGAGPADRCGFRIATEPDLTPPAAPTPDPFTTEERAALKDDKVKAALKKGDLLLLPGRYYVGGLAISLEESRLYSKQAGYPFDDLTKAEALKGANWIAYLDVWEDFVAADQDDSISEPALGGVDTCGRALVRWQVRILLTNKIKDFEDFATRGSGRLTARTKPGQSPDSPCIIPPDARYRGIENQLYRVEIHRGSDADGKGATFKWSRDNGSLIYPVKDIDDELIRVTRLGRDETSSLASGNWVELVDDVWAGRDPGGLLARVATVVPDDRTVTLEWAEPAPALPMRDTLMDGLRPVLRRWDHPGKVDEYGGAIAVEEGVEIELEDGIVIRFEPGGRYSAGDFWLIPARVATADILWPGAPDAREARGPDGPMHHYAPLASLSGGTFKDLRSKFDPISNPF